MGLQSMNASIKLLFGDKIIKWGLGASLTLLGIQALLLGIFYITLPPILPIYNQLPWGESRLGAKIELLIPFGIIAIFISVNYFLISKLHTTMPLISRVISITTLLTSLLALIFIVQTIHLLI